MALDDALSAARAASKADRIVWRDEIAAYGQTAIPAMRGWLADADLGAFAIRVLDRIAQRPDDRRAAVEAVAAVDRVDISPAVARDIADFLGRHSPTPRVVSRSSATKGFSLETASPLERRFHEDVLAVYRRAGEATRKERSDGTFVRGYWATYFLRAVRNHGGLAYAHTLLAMDGTTDGFSRLTEEGRLDLTMEALVIRPEYASLFSESERQVAASRLARAGYKANMKR